VRGLTLSNATTLILERLAKLDFKFHHGKAAPFGEPLPLVTGMAWDETTAQVALIAETNGNADVALWRQLLFAGSGIRHQLAGDGPSAFGTPLILAIVDDDQQGVVRVLAEDLIKSYAVFNRVDLNILTKEHVADPGRVDDALAPLLPRCRSLLGQEISRGEVQKFWSVLRDEVEKAAQGLDGRFGDRRSEAGRRAADALIGDSADAPQLPVPTPISSMLLKHFRSVRKMPIDFAQMNVVYGPNGSGKTTIVEAMELGWAGTSQRVPEDVEADDYAKHLPTDGEGSFALTIDGRTVSAVSDTEGAELARCVLTHEAMSELVSEAPEERFDALLKVTGLEIPDLKSRTGRLIDETKERVDRVFQAAGIDPPRTKSTAGLGHLQKKLKSGFLKEFIDLPELITIEKSLASVSQRRFISHDQSATEAVGELLGRADTLVAEVFNGGAGDETIAAALDAANSAVAELLTARTELATSCRRLVQALAQREALTAETSPLADADEDQDAPISVGLATRWLAHSEELSKSAERFKDESLAVDSEDWSSRLAEYAEALQKAAHIPPVKKLRQLSEPRGRPALARIPEEIDEGLFRAVGFRTPTMDPEVLPPLRELASTLQEHVEGLQQINTKLGNHAARRYGAHAEPILDALCDYELARSLRREGPIMDASEKLISELLDDRLAPAVRELVAAVVRFEWYFKPLLMSTDTRQIVLAGLATSRSDLDARLVLNSAERTIVGLAWFLALHLLQPPERRRVLVLDDPTAGFDKANQAGFTSTLRAFVRLLKPEQVVITTHDDAVASVLTEEFTAVEGWPKSMLRLRVQRDEEDFSVAEPQSTPEPPRPLSEESKELGLLEDATASG
jgi:energy-coupling factor transporter ATP-binding protein EcfA2